MRVPLQARLEKCRTRLNLASPKSLSGISRSIHWRRSMNGHLVSFFLLKTAFWIRLTGARPWRSSPLKAGPAKKPVLSALSGCRWRCARARAALLSDLGSTEYPAVEGVHPTRPITGSRAALRRSSGRTRSIAPSARSCGRPLRAALLGCCSRGQIASGLYLNRRLTSY